MDIDFTVYHEIDMTIQIRMFPINKVHLVLA